LNLRQPKFGRYQIKSDSKLFAPAHGSIPFLVPLTGFQNAKKTLR
jgi:hypothetical protein